MNSNNSTNILLLSFVFFLLTTISYAQENEGETNSSTDSSITVPTTVINKADVSNSNTGTPDEVEPLESWDMKALSIPTTIKINPTQQPTEGVLPPEHEASIPPEVWTEEMGSKLDSRYNEKKVPLSKKDEQRLFKAFKRQKEVVRNLREEFFSKDSRGPAELILCAINVNGYGLKNEYQEKFSDGKGSKKYLAMEESFITAINAAKCNVVVLQNFLGLRPLSAKEGLSILTEKLNSRDNATWRFFYPEYYTKSKFTNAFLINDNSIQVTKIENLHNIKLPKFDKFLLSSFAIPPTKMIFNFNSPNPLKTRKITLLASFLGTNVGTDNPGLPNSQMQIAEINRVLMKSLHEKESDNDLSLLVAERAGPKSSNAGLVLEGRLRLKDFQSSGSCKFDREYKVTCSPPDPGYFKELFGIMKEGIPPDLEDKKQLEIFNTLTPDIYFFDRDLKFALIHHLQTSRYKIGFQEVKNGLKNSPLIWVELNW